MARRILVFCVNADFPLLEGGPPRLKGDPRGSTSAALARYLSGVRIPGSYVPLRCGLRWEAKRD